MTLEALNKVIKVQERTVRRLFKQLTEDCRTVEEVCEYSEKLQAAQRSLIRLRLERLNVTKAF